MKRIHLNVITVIMILICTLISLGLLYVTNRPTDDPLGSGDIYVIGNTDNFPVEAYIDGRWVGMMPEMFKHIQQETGIDIAYLDGDDDWESYISDNQAEMIGALSGQQVENLAEHYNIISTEIVFSYADIDYHMGFTELATSETIDTINLALENLSPLDRVEIAMAISTDPIWQIPDWVVLVIILSCVVIIVMLIVRRKTQHSYERSIQEIKEGTVYKGVKNTTYFKDVLSNMQGEQLHHLYFICYIEIEIAAIKWFYGEEEAEKCIVNSYEILKDCLDENGILARESEKTLLVVLPSKNESKTRQQMLEILARLNGYLNNEFSTVDAPIVASACQVSSVKGDYNRLMRALRYTADIAKETQKSYIISNNKIIDRLYEIIELGGDLVERTDLSDFVIHLQPSIDSVTKRITGAQALVRWDNGEKGLLQPRDFLRHFETSGKIKDLNYWVFESICRFISKNDPKSFIGRSVACSMSLANIQDENFKMKITAAITMYNLPRGVISIELKSDVIQSDDIVIEKNLTFLNNSGIEIVVEKFGGRNTYLPLFARYKIKRAKLDPVFTDGVDKSDHYDVLKSLVTMGHSLNIELVCEQVETAEQEKIFEKLNVDHLMGFKFYRPMPEEEFAELIKSS